jgi:hypothetical protein
MNKLHKFIKTPIETDEIDLSKYVNKEKEEEKEIDLEEIKREINKSVHYTLGKYFK